MRPDLMLAQRGKPDAIPFLQARGFLWDLKVDGIRCCTRIEGGEVCMWSRGGENITHRFPEVAAALQATFGVGTWEFDGELAVNDERGLPSWPLTHKRQSRGARAAGSLPATYHVFDLLRASAGGSDGVDLRQYGFAARRDMLEAILEPGQVVMPVLHSHDGEALWKVIEEHRLEGMVAKRSDHTYRPGRSGDWVKIKRTSTLSALVGGFDEGTGARQSTFGALHLYLLDGEDLVPIGRVGSGFSERDLRQVVELMQKPPLVVEVQYLDLSPDGQLRQPVFLRIRRDQGIGDCTMEQLA